MSVLVLKMREVSCGIEARGDDLSVAVQVMNVTPEQLSNVGLWQYLRGYLGESAGPHSYRWHQVAFVLVTIRDSALQWWHQCG